MYTDSTARKRFKSLIQNGLKGSGDYGVLSFGMYNGQTANTERLHGTDNFHYVARATYPFKINGKYVEASINGYYGLYQLNTAKVGDSVNVNNAIYNKVDGPQYEDYRLGFTAIYYPQPFGFQAEWNMGVGPEYSTSSSATSNGEIIHQSLHDGYISLIGNFHIGKWKAYPFIRAQYYKGGKKFEQDARSYDMTEIAIGTELTPFFPFEIALEFAYADRKMSDSVAPTYHETGYLLRLQLQVNY